jgi:hypothetical protein
MTITTIPGLALGRTVIYVDMVGREYAAIISKVENAERGLVQLHVLVSGGTGVRVVQGAMFSAKARADTWHWPAYQSQQGGQQ